MNSHPLKFDLYAETITGTVQRSLEVQGESGHNMYRLRMLDVVNTNIANHGLMTPDNAEPAQSKLVTEVLGVFTTLEKANAEAQAVFEKYVIHGWQPANGLA